MSAVHRTVRVGRILWDYSLWGKVYPCWEAKRGKHRLCVIFRLDDGAWVPTNSMRETSVDATEAMLAAIAANRPKKRSNR